MLAKLKDKFLDIFLEMFDSLAVFGLGVFFGVGALFIEPKFTFFVMGFLYGAFLGFAALPVFDSDRWTFKPLICAVIGALLSIGLAVFLGWSITNIFLGGIGGLVLGYFAPGWAKYM